MHCEGKVEIECCYEAMDQVDEKKARKRKHAADMEEASGAQQRSERFYNDFKEVSH